MSLRTPLGRVLGRGTAHRGVGHWWVQRLTAIALVPLGIWFLVSLLALPALDQATVRAWMGHEWTALLLMLLVVVAARHSQLGLQVIIEDYVHGEGAKTLLVVTLGFAHVLLALAGVLAVLRVLFGAAP